MCLPMATASAHNDTDTGGELEIECEQQEAPCFAYLSGVWDGATGLSNLANSRLMCPGGRANAEQLRLVFDKFARNHPEFPSRDRAYVAIAAFRTAFSCPPDGGAHR